MEDIVMSMTFNSNLNKWEVTRPDGLMVTYDGNMSQMEAFNQAWEDWKAERD